ncbi:MAG TPA: B12-binding domain-containing radical SAM protein [bacterium]|nr:B12-binding domain-containing radical SAM protein [bacterium]
MKIYFYQLPAPLINKEKVRENTMNSAGYLISYFMKQYPVSDFEFYTADSFINDEYGDAALINHILISKPDVLCFTCYCWNIGRTKLIASIIKNQMPEIKIVFGGPEITADNDYLLTENPADFLVTGEGERLFEKLLVLNFNLAPDELGFILKNDKGKYYFNGYGKPVQNLGDFPSPYLCGIIKPEKNGFMRFETQRGCNNKCSYCYYGKEFGTKRILEPVKVIELFEYALQNNASEIFLLDPDFLARKDIAELLKRIIKINSGNNKIELHTELNAELITAEIAGLLKLANFKSAEIGLQSVNTDKLKLIGRNNNLGKIVSGANLLKSNGINVILDMIIGLPEETPDDVLKTVKFIKNEGFASDAQAFNLAVLPGTKLRTDSKKFGIEYMFEPPYYCLKNNSINNSELISLFEETENVFGVEFDPIEPPSFIENRNSDSSVINISNSGPPYGGAIKINNTDMNNFEIIDKIIIDYAGFNINSQTFEIIRKSFDSIKNKVSNNFCLWLKNCRREFSDLTADMIFELTSNNKSAVFDFIIEPENIGDTDYLHLLFAKEFLNNGHYINNYYYFNFGGAYSISSKKILLLKEDVFNKIAKSENIVCDGFYYIPLFEDASNINRLKKHLKKHQDVVLKIEDSENVAPFLEDLKKNFSSYAELIHFTDSKLQNVWNGFFGLTPAVSENTVILV